jgi:uncharacterized protein with gpF-like domain
MNKQTIISILFTLVALAGQAQTKTATITGYSPALKDGTVAESTVDNVRIANDIAKKLANGDFKASMRYARTMSTNAQNAGRYGAYRRLEDSGVPLTLEWAATLDGRTRHEHRMMHGQRRNVNEPFVVDGVEILYPAWMGMGDYKVPPDMVWNCRCTILAYVKGFEHDTIRQSKKMDGMSFEEWLEAKPVSDPITKQRDIGNKMRAINAARYKDKKKGGK